MTPEYAGCSSEPWPSTKSTSPPRSTPFEHELLRRAGDEVGDDRVDGDPPARDRDPGLPGRHELALRCRAAAPRGRARARRSSSRSRSRSRRSGPSSRRASGSRRSARSGPGGGLRRSRSSTPCSRASSASSGSSETNSCRPFSTSSPARIAVLQELAPRRREPPALRRDADERRRRLVLPRLFDAAHDGEAVLRVARRALRVEDRDDVLGPVAHHPARGLAVVRVGRMPLREDQQPTRLDTESRRRRGQLHAVDELDAGPRIVREQQVAVEIDVVEQARDVRAGRDAEARTRPCSRASRRARARARRAPCAPPSRMPPDFASLMLIPCARSAHAATSASVWQSSST